MKHRLTAQDKQDIKLMTKAVKEDPEWELVRKGSHNPSDYNRFKRIRCRIVKKALEVILQDYKISVRQGSGTAHNWVNVKIVLSRKPKIEPDGAIFNDKTEEIKHRTNRLLEQLPIAYSTFLTDFGGGNDYYAPCVITHCQAFELKK